MFDDALPTNKESEKSRSDTNLTLPLRIPASERVSALFIYLCVFSAFTSLKQAEVFTLNFISLIGLALTIGVARNSEKHYT